MYYVQGWGGPHAPGGERWLDGVRGPGRSARAGSAQTRAHLLAFPLFEELDGAVVHKASSKGGKLVSSAAIVEQYSRARQV